MGDRISAQMGRELCESLGINSKRVTAITIECKADDVPRVTVEMIAGDSITKVLRKYEIKERSNG